MKILVILSFLSAAVLFFTSKNAITESNANTINKEFRDYWMDGKAEVASYQLTQNRYGQLHEGKAVLIFVTEDFSKSKHVKLDNPSGAGKDKLPILKLNFAKNFNTGIYPYSILNSVFTPLDLTGTVKTTCTVQEWCGHTYTQLNKKGNNYDVRAYSYFESEGDQTKSIDREMLEDELWNIIRIAPGSLPDGKVKLIRGNTAVRLMHLPLEEQTAEISHNEGMIDNVKSGILTITYPERTLKIYHETSFPYTISGWDETYGEFGKSPETTKARLLKSQRLEYWKLHGNEHKMYRDSLGL